ncbi:hypothetical protein DMA15_21070 [Streptomyces sp. WAC 01529]|uniref:DUF3558 domain-containing protein n=1 Tax=Streptomyces sp. WAC 01529 TaxID=2203205 RepID=UPI000F6D73A1|nr:DUF3558 domain-containing protein [Streptomyces sp. WAC 01529]AZM54739.1 hypothetical protein DMA15_21070 [Streptomyces sp. WAC 01529]
MQRKVYVPGIAALLAALLVGCTAGSGGGDESADSKPGDTGSSAAPAQPGKYRTLPEPCGEVEPGTLDAMLPGLKEMDTEQREKAYEGTPTVTYDTDRRVGCSWKVESSGASHHLLIDFERVVSYDGAVSDDDRATEVYATKLREADLSQPAGSGGRESDDSDDSAGDKAQGGKSAGSATRDEDDNDKPDKGGKDGKSTKGTRAEESGDDESPATAPATPPPGLEPRTLDDLGEEAFLDDALTTAASATRHRTVTVVFRTSNVIVTIEYDEQPGRRTDVPDSKEMQDKALELADALAGTFDE